MTAPHRPAPTKKPAKSTQKPSSTSGFDPMDEERDIYAWKAPERLHKQRGREFYSTASAFVVLLSIIALFFKEFFLMTTIWAFAFITYVMTKTPPEATVHAITTRGVRSGQRKYYWGELLRFWFEDKWGKTILHIDTLRAFPRRLMLVLDTTPKEQMKELLLRHIPYDKPEMTWVERATRWLQEKVPLEEESKPRVSAPATK